MAEVSGAARSVTVQLSVVVPVRNGARFIGALLDSLARQETGGLAGFEVVVVDDASTDDTAAILKSYSWVRVLTHPRQRGAGAARNTGAKAARGDVLVFLDADTRVRDRDFLARCAAVLDEHPDCVAFSGCYFDENPQRDAFSCYLDAAEARMREAVLDRLAIGSFNGCVCGVRRAVFEAMGGFSEDRRVALEDVDLGFRMGLAGHRHWFSGELRVEHRQPRLWDYARELVPRTRCYMALIRRYRFYSDVMGGQGEGIARVLFLLGVLLSLGGMVAPALGLAGLLVLAGWMVRSRHFLATLTRTMRPGRLPLAFVFHAVTSTALVVGAVLGVFDSVRFAVHRRLVDVAMIVAYGRSLVNRRSGGYLIHFLTHRCNAHCLHCFDHPQRERIGRADELDLPRIRRVAASAGPLGHVSLTGGEPLLRDDIAEVVAAYYAAGVRSFSLASNGSYPERLAELLPRLAAAAPFARIIVKTSVDGVGETHDRLRRVPGLYAKVERSLRALADAQRWMPLLRIHVCLTLTQENAAGLDATLECLRALAPDQIEINRLRGTPMEPGLRGVNDATYEAACVRVANANGGVRGLTHVLARLDQAMFSIVRDPQAPWPCGSCLAGRRLAVIHADGTVLPCEMIRTVRARDGAAYDGFTLGRLDAYQDDLRALLAGEQARRVTDYIAKSDCRCSFECAILATLTYRPWRFWRFLVHRPSKPEGL